MPGSLKNVIVVKDSEKHSGFMFSLLNPPVPLGGNIVSLDVYVDELPVQRKSIFVATAEDVVNAATLSESRPMPFKPYQSARFLVVSDSGLDAGKKHKISIMSKLEGFEDIAIPFTFSDSVSAEGKKEKIIIPSDTHGYDSPEENDTTIFRNFTSPLVLSGKKAYVVCSSNGALSANWTWMGVRYDNGGLYVPPVRAFGRIIVEVSMDDGVRKRLPNFVVSSRHENGILLTHHDLAGLRVTRKLVVPFESRGFIMEIELALRDALGDGSIGKKKPKRSVRLHFMIDGNITSYGLAAISQSNISKFNARDNCLEISSAGATKDDKVEYFGTVGVAPRNLKPGRVLTDSFDNDLELSYDVGIEAGQTVRIALVGTGSFSSAEQCLKEFRSMRDNSSALVEQTEKGFKKFSSSTLSASLPPPEKRSLSVSRLFMAYEKAKTCLQYLKAEYDGLGEGICAGLPRFPNYWARDTGWSLRGYLAAGDYRFARAVMDNFLAHQAKKTENGAVAGELPMIISGKAFLHNTTFGSADSTFLFPWAIREYVLATADVKYLKKWWESIVALVDCGLYKDIDGDGLVDHGFTGTAEKLPIRDSTWMDHIDRRKSANDVQALFYESLTVGSELAGIAGDGYNRKRWAQRAEQLRSKIDREYWNGGESFYHDTIRRDGSKDPSIRPNALVLLLTGAAEKSRARPVLERIEKDDITAAWGVRTLSTKDPKYHPTHYHDGAVWPLVTSWAALGEIKHGRAEQGLFYMNSMAERIMAENGMFAETYRGDRPEPFNSCILQAWSAGMYVYAMREMMLGIKMDMLENRISFNPSIPESLTSAGHVLLAFEQRVEGADARGRLQTSIDPYNRKISVRLKGWKGKRPEFVAGSGQYEIGVSE